MARLVIPDKQRTLSAFDEIRQFLNKRGILIEQWEANTPLAVEANEQSILNAYAHKVQPYMAQHGYQTADVITVNAHTPNLDQIRAKFLAEHTHSEDEVRFFVDGQGFFWFNLEDNTPQSVFCVHCSAGDFLSVPAGFKHWFDMGDPAFVKVIRIFTDQAGWTPHYTNSGIDRHYDIKAFAKPASYA